MGFLSRMRALLWGSNDGLDTVRVINVGASASGVSVNADNVLRNATAWACITYLARTVGQLPWRVMQDMGNAAPRRVPTHPVEYLLHVRPNPEMGAFTWRETMVGWATRYGNAVSEIVRDNRGVPTALWPMHPSKVNFKRDVDSGALVFGLRDNTGGERILTSQQVFHVRGFGEGAVGLDVVSYAAESLGWAQATELFGSSFFGNGLNPAGFLYVPGKMSREGKDALDAELSNRHGGPAKGNRVMMLDGQMKFEKSGVEPDSAQFIETRQHQIEEICRWFGVPPHKVMHMLRATFSNIEHQSIEVVVDSITPWALRFEQEADYKLFGNNRQWFFTKLDLKGLLRGDFRSRAEGLQLMRRNGVINANEWRRLEDMDEIGEMGDKYIVESNMTTLEQVGQVPAPAPAPMPLSADTEDDAEEDGAEDDAAEESTSPGTAVERARLQAARAALH